MERRPRDARFLRPRPVMEPALSRYVGDGHGEELAGGTNHDAYRDAGSPGEEGQTKKRILLLIPETWRVFR